MGLIRIFFSFAPLLYPRYLLLRYLLLVLVFLKFLQFVAQGLLLPVCYLTLLYLAYIEVHLDFAVLSYFTTAFYYSLVFNFTSLAVHFSFLSCSLCYFFHFVAAFTAVCRLSLSTINWGYPFVCLWRHFSLVYIYFFFFTSNGIFGVNSWFPWFVRVFFD